MILGCQEGIQTLSQFHLLFKRWILLVGRKRLSSVKTVNILCG